MEKHAQIRVFSFYHKLKVYVYMSTNIQSQLYFEKQLECRSDQTVI